MKKLILILTLLFCAGLFAQTDSDLELLFRADDFEEDGGNLFASGLVGLYTGDVPKLALKVSPPAPAELTQTATEVQAILDGTYISNMTLSNAAPSFTIHDTDASAGSSDVVIEADGGPTITFHSADGNSGTINFDVVNNKIGFTNNVTMSAGLTLTPANSIIDLAGATTGDLISNGVLTVSTSGSGDDITIDPNSVGAATLTLGVAGDGDIVNVNAGINFAADGQGDDDYEISLPTVTSLVAGLTVTFAATTLNTDGATLEITEVGDIDALVKVTSAGVAVALATGDIIAKQIVVAVFDADGNWQIVSRLAQ